MVLLARRLHPEVYDRVIELCRHAGFSPTVAYEAFPVASVVMLVAAGLGVSIVPAFVPLHFTLPGLTYRRLRQGTPTLPLYVCWRREGSSRVVEQMVQAVRAWADER